MERTNKTKTVVHPAAIEWLTDATWDFAHRILWSDQHFSETEIEISKNCIREYYEEIPADVFAEQHLLHFEAYCERVLLAKGYVDRYPSRYIPHPCIWLNKNNAKGFAGTKEWYIRKKKREGHYIFETPNESRHSGKVIHLHIELSIKKEVSNG
jgi:hypothetical protein